VSSDPPTHLSLDAAPARVEDLIARAEAAMGHRFVIFGELGRNAAGTVALLGRDRSSRSLVAIRIRPVDGRPGTYQADVLRQLDSSLPELRSECPACLQVLGSWTPFCPFCAADLSRVAVSRSGRSREELLDLVRRAAAGRYEVLGEMDRRGGGGLVYFGRDEGTGELVAMRLLEAMVPSDRRGGVERRAGGERRADERRGRDEPVDVERRQGSKPKYSLDLTDIINPLDDGSGG
jgi:hypothetical protein